MNVPTPTSDGVLTARWKIEHGHLVRQMSQDDKPILEHMSEVRKNAGALRKFEWGEPALNIPEIHYWRLVKKYPGLSATDGAERTAAWAAFLLTSDADPFRYRSRSLRRG